MSTSDKNDNDSLTPKLRKLQLKLIEKRYGPLAGLFIRNIFNGELSKKDLRRSEAILKLLFQYSGAMQRFSGKLGNWRELSFASSDGGYLMLVLLILQFIASIYLFNAI